MQMTYSAMILSMVTAFILLSSSLVSYFAIGNDIVLASSDEGGDGGSDEGGDGGGEGEGNEEQDNGGGEEEDTSEQPAAGEQEDGAEDQLIPEGQQQQLPEGEQGEEVGQFVLCDESEVFNPATGKCEDEVPQAQGGSGEICDNSKDDDLDGDIDESNCVPAGGEQQAGIANPIPSAFTPNLLAGQIGGWGLPQGSTQGLDQGQGQEGSSDGGSNSGTNIPPVPSFSPSSSQGSIGAPGTTQGSGSDPAQGANDGTTQIPSFTPTGSTGGGNQGGSPGTNTNTNIPSSTGSGDQGDSEGTGSGGGAGQRGSIGGGGSGSGTAPSTGTGTSISPSTGTYTDPNGRFSIGYPPNAKVIPADENSPGDKVVTFTAPPPTEFTSIGIEVTDTGSPIELESHVNSYLVALETALPSYALVQSPDCVRYALGGQKACAYIYTVGEQTPAATDVSSSPTGQISSSQGGQKAIMEVYSVVGNSLYKISYSTLPNDFNAQLPVAEGMIRSFSLLDSNTS